MHTFPGREPLGGYESAAGGAVELERLADMRKLVRELVSPYDVHMKAVLGLVIAALVGGVCRWADVPSPCPNRLLGAFLVVAMTGGYVLVDRLLSSR